MEGIDVVLDTMKMRGMAESAKIVERYLVEDGIVSVSGDGENKNKEEDEEEQEFDFVSEVARLL